MQLCYCTVGRDDRCVLFFLEFAPSATLQGGMIAVSCFVWLCMQTVILLQHSWAVHADSTAVQSCCITSRWCMSDSSFNAKPTGCHEFPVLLCHDIDSALNCGSR